MFSEGFGRRMSAAVLAGLVLGVGFAFYTAEGVMIAGGSLGGDYPAFYGAGKIVAAGHGDELYDWSRQAAAQAGLHAEGDGGFLIFSYPAFVALIYAPLSQLPFLASLALYMTLLTAALAAAVWLAAPMLPNGRGQEPVLALLLAACYPLLASVLGGQNTALSLLLFTAVWRALDGGRDGLAGAAAALLLFKPQFGIPLLVLLAIGGRPRALLGAAPVAAALYLLGALAAGPDWPQEWWAGVRRFQAATQPLEAGNAVGLIGLVSGLWGGKAAQAAGWALTAALALALALCWRRRVIALDGLLAATACALVILSPHAIFYDAGLAGLALFYLFGRGGRWAAVALPLLLLGSWSGLLSEHLGFSPLFFFLLAAIVLTARAGRAPPSRQGA